MLILPSNPTGPTNGILLQGSFTSNDLVGPLKGKQMSDLVKLINDGQAYANVHTQTTLWKRYLSII